MTEALLEPVLDPALPLCDAHHHLWASPHYLVPQLEADLGSGHRIASTVFVEWRSHYREAGPPELRPVGEVAFARAAGEMAQGPARVCAGIVGFADLCLGEAVRPVLEAEIVAGGGRFKGIRYVASWDDDPEVLGGTAASGPGLYRSAAFRDGFRTLVDYGLSFDAWLFPTQLDDLIDLAEAFPDQPVVLNHCGGVLGIGRYESLRAELYGFWLDRIRRLARAPNVWMKLGGLGMKRCGLPFHGEPEQATSEQLAEIWRPWIEPCIDSFGPERCLFESNFPVDRATCSYRVLWNTFKRLAGGSPSERAALLHDTAARFYRLSY